MGVTGANQAAVALALMLLMSANVDATLSKSIISPHPFGTTATAFGTNLSSVNSQNLSQIQQSMLQCRGGATMVDDDSEYESEEEDEDEIVMKTKSLSKSTRKAASKAKAKKTKASKSAVSQSLSQSNTKSSISSKKKKSIYKKVPYIIRAILNPFIGVAMIKAYFASLFNIDFGAEDSSQSLRSALEEKAKKAGGSGSGSGASGGAKRARKMRPGQAKTLSDLPQLSA